MMTYNRTSQRLHLYLASCSLHMPQIFLDRVGLAMKVVSAVSVIGAVPALSAVFEASAGTDVDVSVSAMGIACIGSAVPFVVTGGSLIEAGVVESAIANASVSV